MYTILFLHTHIPDSILTRTEFRNVSACTWLGWVGGEGPTEKTGKQSVSCLLGWFGLGWVWGRVKTETSDIRPRVSPRLLGWVGGWGPTQEFPGNIRKRPLEDLLMPNLGVLAPVLYRSEMLSLLYYQQIAPHTRHIPKQLLHRVP